MAEPIEAAPGASGPPVVLSDDDLMKYMREKVVPPVNDTAHLFQVVEPCVKFAQDNHFETAVVQALVRQVVHIFAVEGLPLTVQDLKHRTDAETVNAIRRRTAGLPILPLSSKVEDTPMPSADQGHGPTVDGPRPRVVTPPAAFDVPPSGDQPADNDSDADADATAIMAVCDSNMLAAAKALVIKNYSKVQSPAPKGRVSDYAKRLDVFHGTTADMGKPAKDWLTVCTIYYNATHLSVDTIATYLRDDALAWWVEFGRPEVGRGTFADFSKAFLARFVKAGDSTKARTELASMQQNGLTVEAFAAKFTNCASRVAASSVGTPVDSTTQAGYFLNGLKQGIVNKLNGIAEPETMHNIDKLIAAAIHVEANMDVSNVAQTGNGQQRATEHVQGSRVARHSARRDRHAPYQGQADNGFYPAQSNSVQQVSFRGASRGQRGSIRG
ncbi:TPA: hypothetical protein ACH3X1_014166 [Trebouxia sp. C0004]